jgi:hypothetical protein
MDPMSALSLAASVIQFVDFGTKLISKGHEIYHSETGQAEENIELEVIYEDLSWIGEKLKAFSTASSISSGQSREEEALVKLASTCKTLADELLATLRDLRVAEGPHRKWRSFRKALSTIWKKEKIEALQEHLDRLRDHLSLQLIAISKYTIISLNQVKITNEIL